MDWYLPDGDLAAASGLRQELGAHLRRHASSPDGVEEADLVVAELLANAVEHASGPAWVSLRWDGERPELSVADLGPGFSLAPSLPADALADGGRGLVLVEALAERLEVVAREHGGSVVRAVLPVQRRPEPDLAPPRSRTHALPGLEEADPQGGFGRDAFLRALVVQLAQAVEDQQGPDAAAAAVAQVGVDVGGQVEAEYRRATGAAGPLTPEQAAEAMVRLKRAVGGGFRAVHVEEDRVVLETSTCPFGDAVTRAPALCRVTTSVFGGLAAAAGDDDRSAVSLERRIAVGDHSCRVVVWLRGDDPAVPPGAQRFVRPRS